MIEVGNAVERIANDSYNGRKGNVIEIDSIKGRARVEWHTEGYGKPVMIGGVVKTIRTWVRFQDLKVIA